MPQEQSVLLLEGLDAVGAVRKEHVNHLQRRGSRVGKETS